MHLKNIYSMKMNKFLILKSCLQLCSLKKESFNLTFLFSSKCELLLHQARPKMFSNSKVRSPAHISIVMPGTRESGSVEWKSGHYDQKAGSKKHNNQKSVHVESDDETLSG